jgi:FkbM family methyltransferase
MIYEHNRKLLECREVGGDLTFAKKNLRGDYYNKHMLLNKDDIVLDIGAHIGAFTISIFDKVKEVIAFEPEPVCNQMLEYNCALNDTHNVRLAMKAVVGNDDFERRFFTGAGKSQCSHSLIANRNQRIETVVKCLNINTVLKETGATAIKINAEGAEYEIMKAMDYSKIRSMAVEFHFGQLKDKTHEKFHELITIAKQHFDIVDYKEKEGHYWNNITDFFCLKK